MKVDIQGKPARTHYEMLCSTESKDKSLVRLELQTGRTHQIRVHMASIGHPLLADPFYGEPDQELKRTALHAGSLDFLQPFTGEKVHVEASLPKDFYSSLSSMGFL
jgi:23S rRNA pseudouridine1911/1915/1917 synthase